VHCSPEFFGPTATHLRLRDAALGAQGSHQRINFAGGDASDVGLNDHGVESLLHPVPELKD
jgi:hypothetical protein